MTSREERIARNEATAREINEGIERSHDGDDDGELMRVLCECGDPDCEQVLAMKIEEYEKVRSNPLWFAMRRDHVNPGIDEVVSSTDRFVVAAKREGVPAEIAAEEDPRS